MSRPNRRGRPVQILRKGTKGCWELNKEALQTILLNDIVKDKPVAVVSVVGKFRLGKSFLLNFFLRYMHSDGQEDWLGGPNERLEGFSWRGGCERDTAGILVWDKVFLVPKAEGGDLAVLLMDTQGTFDTESTMKQSSIVFALSFLISSIFVYNLSGNVFESDLQHLELFTEFGTMARKGGNMKPSEKLMVLVRDWYHTCDAPHGATGGRMIIGKRLEGRGSKPKELQQLRKRLKRCFGDIDCFLMPNPGPQVTGGRDFDGRVSGIDPDFLRNLRDFIPLVLGKENLQAKLINDEVVTCQGLLSYIECYMSVFTGKELPSPKSVFEATAEANNLVAVAKAEDFYRTEMQERLKNGLSAKEFEKAHAELRLKALDVFRLAPKIGGNNFALKYEAMLEKKIEYLYSTFKHQTKSMVDRIMELLKATLPVLGCLCLCVLAPIRVAVPHNTLLATVTVVASAIAYYCVNFFRTLFRRQDADLSPPRDNTGFSSPSFARGERIESQRRGRPKRIVTALTLLGLTAVFHSLSVTLDLVGLYAFGRFCSLLTTVCVICLLLWACVRASGKWSNVGDWIDGFAEATGNKVQKLCKAEERRRSSSSDLTDEEWEENEGLRESLREPNSCVRP